MKICGSREEEKYFPAFDIRCTIGMPSDACLSRIRAIFHFSRRERLAHRLIRLAIYMLLQLRFLPRLFKARYYDAGNEKTSS